jgi:hypothetical protein
MAIVNPSGVSETISINVEIESGAVAKSSITLPAQGHMAFALMDQFPSTVGHHGMAEFYIARGGISSIALRFNPTGGFTTAPVFAQSGAPIIGVTPPTSGR